MFVSLSRRQAFNRDRLALENYQVSQPTHTKIDFTSQLAIIVIKAQCHYNIPKLLAAKYKNNCTLY